MPRSAITLAIPGRSPLLATRLTLAADRYVFSLLGILIPWQQGGGVRFLPRFTFLGLRSTALLPNCVSAIQPHTPTHNFSLLTLEHNFYIMKVRTLQHSSRPLPEHHEPMNHHLVLPIVNPKSEIKHPERGIEPHLNEPPRFNSPSRLFPRTVLPLSRFKLYFAKYRTQGGPR